MAVTPLPSSKIGRSTAWHHESEIVLHERQLIFLSPHALVSAGFAGVTGGLLHTSGSRFGVSEFIDSFDSMMLGKSCAVAKWDQWGIENDHVCFVEWVTRSGATFFWQNG